MLKCMHPSTGSMPSMWPKKTSMSARSASLRGGSAGWLALSSGRRLAARAGPMRRAWQKLHMRLVELPGRGGGEANGAGPEILLGLVILQTREDRVALAHVEHVALTVRARPVEPVRRKASKRKADPARTVFAAFAGP